MVAGDLGMNEWMGIERVVDEPKNFLSSRLIYIVRVPPSLCTANRSVTTMWTYVKSNAITGTGESNHLGNKLAGAFDQ
jgi:hypothetical protein